MTKAEGRTDQAVWRAAGLKHVVFPDFVLSLGLITSDQVPRAYLLIK